MSRWTHASCEACWVKRHPGQGVTAIRQPDLETCCYCDTATLSGFYDREDPDVAPCKGLNGTVHRIN